MSFGKSISLGTSDTSFGVSNPMLGGADSRYIDAQKAKERQAIRALLASKNTYLNELLKDSNTWLEELRDTMYEQSSKSIPNSLDETINGLTSKSAKEFLLEIKKPALKTPIKMRPLA